MLQKRCILFVDDEEDVLKVIVRKVLMHYADIYEPLVAHDGYDALSYLREKDIAIAVLDIQMHNLNGVELEEAYAH